jgi:hypothetical protein
VNCLIGDRGFKKTRNLDVGNQETPKPKITSGKITVRCRRPWGKEKDLWIGFLTEVPLWNQKSCSSSKGNLNDPEDREVSVETLQGRRLHQSGIKALILACIFQAGGGRRR